MILLLALISIVLSVGIICYFAKLDKDEEIEEYISFCVNSHALAMKDISQPQEKPGSGRQGEVMPILYCCECGSKNLEVRGIYMYKEVKQPIYFCVDCGSLIEDNTSPSTNVTGEEVMSEQLMLELLHRIQELAKDVDIDLNEELDEDKDDG